MATPPSSSTPVSPKPTPTSSSTPVSHMPISPSSSTPVPIEENKPDLRARRRERQRRSRQRRRRSADSLRDADRLRDADSLLEENFDTDYWFRPIPDGDGLCELIPTAVNLREMPLSIPTWPVCRGSVEGRQQPKERRPVQIRSVSPEARRPPSLCGPVDHVGGRLSALVDLPGEEKPSSNLADASYGLSQPKENLLGEEKPSSYLADTSYGPEEDLLGEEKPSSDLADTSYGPEEDLLGEEKPSSVLADTSYGPSQHKEVRKPWDTNHVLALRDRYLPTPVYVRKDRSGFYHTYPPLDRPLQTLEEVQIAVVSYAGGSSMSEELPRKERIIHEFLYWPDNTSKLCTRVQIANRELEKIRRLVEALLDKRNDDEDCVDELKDIIHWQSICEGAGKWYYHLNITVNTKGAAADAGSANLCFVEVGRDRNDTLGYFINTFFMFNTESEGDEVICHGCINNGSTDMKHARADSFNGGHVDIRFPVGFGPCNEKQWVDSDDSEDENIWRKDDESRIRKTFDYLDDAAYLENLRNKRLHIRT